MVGDGTTTDVRDRFVFDGSQIIVKDDATVVDEGVYTFVLAAKDSADNEFQVSMYAVVQWAANINCNSTTTPGTAGIPGNPGTTEDNPCIRGQTAVNGGSSTFSSFSFDRGIYNTVAAHSGTTPGVSNYSISNGIRGTGVTRGNHRIVLRLTNSNDPNVLPLIIVLYIRVT